MVLLRGVTSRPSCLSPYPPSARTLTLNETQAPFVFGKIPNLLLCILKFLLSCPLPFPSWDLGRAVGWYCSCCFWFCWCWCWLLCLQALLVLQSFYSFSQTSLCIACLCAFDSPYALMVLFALCLSNECSFSVVWTLSFFSKLNVACVCFRPFLYHMGLSSGNPIVFLIYFLEATRLMIWINFPRNGSFVLQINSFFFLYAIRGVGNALSPSHLAYCQILEDRTS